MGSTRWIPKLSKQEKERRRMCAGKDLLDGLSQMEVARKYGVNPSSVCRWKKKIQKEGIEGLKARKALGAPPKLSPDEQSQLKELIVQGAIACGYITDFWTLKRVAKLIEDKFGVKYNPNYVGELLHKLGLSPQKPNRVASERDETARTEWINGEWEESKKTQKWRYSSIH